MLQNCFNADANTRSMVLSHAPLTFPQLSRIALCFNVTVLGSVTLCVIPFDVFAVTVTLDGRTALKSK
jgi:hypothetical protein